MLSGLSSTTLMLGIVLIPCSIWAIRQDKLLRTEDGFVTSAARNTKVEAWEPRKVFVDAQNRIVRTELGDGIAAYPRELAAV